MKIPVSLIGAALLGAATLCSAQGVKIGFLDADRIENESVQARRAQEALKKEFGPREKAIGDLQKQIEADRARFDKERSRLPSSELKARGAAIAKMMRKSDQMAYALAEDLERRKAELRAGIIEEAKAATKVVAEAGKFDLVVRQAIYRSPAVDVTERVLKEMAKRAGTPKR